VTPKARPTIGTLQKRMPTLTQTATNQTAGPLALTCGLIRTTESRILTKNLLLIITISVVRLFMKLEAVFKDFDF
jgi:hypothetical protein